MRCARCGRWFFRLSPTNANWCQYHQVFICRRCARLANRGASCPECKKSTSLAHPMAFIALLLAALLLAPAGLTLTGTDLWDRHFEFASSQPITQATPGSVIKVSGTIGGTPGTIVMDGVYHRSGKYSHWSWTNYDFLVLVGNLTISVSAGGIGGSVYGAPHSLTQDHEQYWVGDAVSVVGSVESSNRLSATAVSSQPDGFWSPWEDWVAVVLDIGMAASVAGLLLVHFENNRRYRMHQARVDSGTPFAYVPSGAPTR